MNFPYTVAGPRAEVVACFVSVGERVILISLQVNREDFSMRQEFNLYGDIR